MLDGGRLAIILSLLVGLAAMGGLLMFGASLSGIASAVTSPEPSASREAEGTPERAQEPPRLTRRPATLEDGRGVAQRLADASLAARIKQALAEERALRVFDFDPEVTSGRVVLYGDVNTRAQGEEALRVTRDVDGVRRVGPQLTVGGADVAWEPTTPGAAEQAATTSGAKASASGGAGQHHTVESGETLWRIAQRYGMSVERLRRLNGLGPNVTIRPGQRLRVR